MSEGRVLIGGRTEKDIARILSKKGYWVLIVPKSASGSQPVDIVAMKGSNNILLDAKHLRKKDELFELSRIEPNQWSSMEFAKKYCELKNLGFAIAYECDNSVRWLSYEIALSLKNRGRASISYKSLPLFDDVWK